jgi:hypothetical protein
VSDIAGAYWLQYAFARFEELEEYGVAVAGTAEPIEMADTMRSADAAIATVRRPLGAFTPKNPSRMDQLLPSWRASLRVDHGVRLTPLSRGVRINLVEWQN